MQRLGILAMINPEIVFIIIIVTCPIIYLTLKMAHNNRQAHK